ncbi:MAG: PEFG-CTERM sorting domain-containing protein [Nitrosopumilaceae archaeon]
MKILQLSLVLGMLLSIGTILPVFAQYPSPDDSSSTTNNAQQNQVKLTDKGTIKVGFYTDPQKPNTSNQTKFYISFMNKDSDLIQQHIDYKVSVKKGTDQVFGIPVTHTATGSVTVPFQFPDVGTYQVVVEVDGILFQPITPETATFTVGIESSSVPEFPANAAIILVIGITSIIALSARSRLTPAN